MLLSRVCARLSLYFRNSCMDIFFADCGRIKMMVRNMRSSDKLQWRGSTQINVTTGCALPRPPTPCPEKGDVDSRTAAGGGLHGLPAAPHALSDGTNCVDRYLPLFGLGPARRIHPTFCCRGRIGNTSRRLQSRCRTNADVSGGVGTRVASGRKSSGA